MMVTPDNHDQHDQLSLLKAQALLKAASRGLHSSVRDLIASGAAVDGIRGSTSRIPLYEAAKAGHAQVVLTLLEEGADVEAVSSQDGGKNIDYFPMHSEIDSMYGYL